MSRKRLVILLSLLFIGSIAASQTFPIRNYDLFWHLKIGQLTLDAGHLLDRDPLTFSAAGKPWIQHEWGAQLILAGVERLGGFWALRLLRGLLIGLCLVLIASLFWRVCPRATAVLGGVVFYWVLAEPFAGMRPHLMGWVFLAAGTLFFLGRAPPWRPTRWLAFGGWLAVWINIHSSALIVPLLCGLAVVELIARAIIDRRWDKAVLSHWIGLAALAGAAIFVQPAGFDLIGYALKTQALNHASSNEWLPLIQMDEWHHNPQLIIFYAFLAVATVAAAAYTLRRRARAVCFPFVLPAMAVLLFSLTTKRMLFLAYFPLLLVLQQVNAVLAERRPYPAGLLKRRWVLPLVALAAIPLLVARSIQRTGGLFTAEPFYSSMVPTRAINFLRQVKLQGHMANIERWGGLLSYFLYPAYKTFLDGRWLMVGRRVFLDSLAIIGHWPDMESLCDRYRIDFLIQPVTIWSEVEPPDETRWVLAYQDPIAVIALRRTEHFTVNARLVCDFYRRRPDWQANARWPSAAPPVPGFAARARLPQILECCCGPERDPG